MTIKGRLSKVLKKKKSVVTRAMFWRISHDTHEDEIALKLGRYKFPQNVDENEIPETLQPKSELTLDDEEFRALIAWLRDNYEPFRQGARAFIPLDKPYERENAAQIKALFALSDRAKLIEFILTNEVIPDDLRICLETANRRKAIREFVQMLNASLVESVWQEWFQVNSWVLGSEFVRVVDERTIDTAHISDFLLQAYDGFLDIVEIKKPSPTLEFWAKTQDHGNFVPSSDLIRAVTQASRYVFEVEREANNVKFLDRVQGVRAVKPRCVLVFGRSEGWTKEQSEGYRILNASFHNLTVLTYDHVLARAKRMIGDG